MGVSIGAAVEARCEHSLGARGRQEVEDKRDVTSLDWLFRTTLTHTLFMRTGKLLGHAQVQTTAHYAQLATDPIKLAANSVSNQLAEMMVG